MSKLYTKILAIGNILIIFIFGFNSCKIRPPKLPDMVNQVDCGEFHTCSVTITGGIFCWGLNQDGQLGTADTVSTNIKKTVGFLANTIASGEAHSCGLNSDGVVKCWGNNQYGQLGDGSNNNSNVPVEVALDDSDSVIAISSGVNHTCALNKNGKVKCWGSNINGQLGDGSNFDSNVPVEVFGLSQVISISGGGAHTCALTQSGGVKCWGSNNRGQLGDGTNIDSNFPIDVYGLSSGIKDITTGENHTCALTEQGAVKCWGENKRGQIGDGTNIDRKFPTYVYGLSSGVSGISAGGRHTCAILSDGGAKCWGWNRQGQLGDGTNNDRNIPVDVQGLPMALKDISGGWQHSCAVPFYGGVKCWGNNVYGQIGDGTNNSTSFVVNVLGFRSW